MYNIFFHIAGLAFIEIIFYFYYIGPIETNIFQDSVKRIIAPLKNDANNNLNPIVIVSPYNSTQYILIENNEENNITQIIKNDVTRANDERDKYNNELFIWTIKCWIYLCLSNFLYNDKSNISSGPGNH